MRRLVDIICEESGDGKFIIKYDERSAVDFLKERNNLSDDETKIIRKYLKTLKERAGSFAIMGSKKYKYLKISRNVKKEFRLSAENINELEFSGGGSEHEKISIIKSPKNVHIFQMGDGQGSRKLITELQETLSTVYINSNKNTWDDLDQLVMKTYPDVDALWVETFRAHATAIKKEYPRMRAVRLGDFESIYNKLGISIDQNDSAISAAYHRMQIRYKPNVIKFTGITNKMRKDIFDKTDVLLYDRSKASDILNDLACPAEEIKATLFDMAIDNKLVGISLKKLVNYGGSFKLVKFNMGENVIGNAKDVIIKPIMRTKGKVTTIQNGLTIDVFTDKDEHIEINLRNFGTPSGMDVKYIENGKYMPAIGKVFWDMVMKYIKSSKFDVNVDSLGDLFTPEMYNKMNAIFNWDKELPSGTVMIFDDSKDSAALAVRLLTALARDYSKDKNFLNDITTKWIKVAAAEVEYALPFVLTKEM